MKVEYSEDKRTAYFDGYKFRRDAKTGYYLANKPTYMGHRERLHVYVWRKHNGPIPEGYHVHHVDEDKSHNDIDNLCCMPRGAHESLHGLERAALKYDEMRKNLVENAIPKAAEWHRGEAGREWHRQNYKRHLAVRPQKEHTCQYCGKTYLSKKNESSKFCSNNCKAAARRKSGVDNETRKCIVCGKDFRCNKYSVVKCCSRECSAQFRRNNRHQVSGQRASL